MFPMCCLIASGSVRRSYPATVPLPFVGESRPHSIRIGVGLPAPFGPREPAASPLPPGAAGVGTPPPTTPRSPEKGDRRARQLVGQDSRRPPWLRAPHLEDRAGEERLHLLRRPHGKETPHVEKGQPRGPRRPVAVGR